MARALLLYNPAARSAPDPSLLQAIGLELRLAGFSVQPAHSEAPGDLTRLARSAASEGYDRVIVCGGDGSVREAAQGLCGQETPLALVPLGTANVLARELGLPVRSPLTCAALAGRGAETPIGLGRVDGDGVFTFCASAGLDSAAVFNVDLGIKRQTGGWAYAYSALQCLLTPLPEFRVCTEGGVRFTAAQVFAARIRRYGAGSLYLSRSASLRSPTLRLIAVPPPLAPRVPLCLFHMLRGGLEGAPGVFDAEVSAFTVESDLPAPVQADGDVLARTPVRLSAQPDALRVIIPKTN